MLQRVRSYLCTGFRFGLRAWLYYALLLRRREREKCCSQQQLPQLRGEAAVLVQTVNVAFLQSFPVWSQLVLPNIPHLWCWLGCASETQGKNRSQPPTLPTGSSPEQALHLLGTVKLQVCKSLHKMFDLQWGLVCLFAFGGPTSQKQNCR